MHAACFYHNKQPSSARDCSWYVVNPSRFGDLMIGSGRQTSSYGWWGTKHITSSLVLQATPAVMRAIAIW
jgi:hypothetical protein